MAAEPAWAPMHWAFQGDWTYAVRELWPLLYINSALREVRATSSNPLAAGVPLMVNCHQCRDKLAYDYQFIVFGEASPWMEADVLQTYALVQWPEYFKVVSDGKVES